MTRLIGIFVFLVWAGSAAAAETRLHLTADVLLAPEQGTLTTRTELTLPPGPEAAIRLTLGRITEATVNGSVVEASVGQDGRWIVSAASAPRNLVVSTEAKLGPFPADPRGPAPRGAFAGPDGIYISGAETWLPHPGFAPIDYTIKVQINDPYRAVMPGSITEESVTGGVYKATFTSEAPMLGIMLAAGRWTIEERRTGDIRVRTYFTEALKALSDDYLADTVGYIERYTDWIGPYPFSAFHVVAGPLPVGLGFEGLTYMGEQVLRLPFIRATSLGHEVLHNWWGNGVFPDYRSGNWAEGLTTFMADYTYAEDEGPEAARERRLNWLRDYAALPPDRDQAPMTFTSKSHGASQVWGYNKVAFFFYMLRQKIGQEAFDHGVQAFWRDHRFKTAGWDDLRNALEEAANDDLKAYFDQWLARPGAPTFRLSNVEPAAEGVMLVIEQTDPVFEVTVPVAIITKDGTERHRITVNAAINSVTLNTRAPVRAVTVDPDFEVFRRLLPGEQPAILRDVMLAEDLQQVVLGTDADFIQAAENLSTRLGDVRPKPVALETLDPKSAAVVFGSQVEIAAFLAQMGLEPMPAELDGPGDVKAWAGRGLQAPHAPRLMIAADSAEALRQATRALPHYGRRSFVAFVAGRKVAAGQLTAKDSPMTRPVTRPATGRLVD